MNTEGIIAVMFAFTICVLLLGVYYKSWALGEQLSIERTHIVASLLGAMISTIANYIGRNR